MAPTTRQKVIDDMLLHWRKINEVETIIRSFAGFIICSLKLSMKLFDIIAVAADANPKKTNLI